MKRFVLIMALFLNGDTEVFAQVVSNDSLEKAFVKLPGDTAKVNRINELARLLQQTDPVKATALTQTAIAIAEKINYALGASVAYSIRGGLFVNAMKLDSGRIYIDKAYALIKDGKDNDTKNQLGMLCNAYGVIYQQRQLYDSATIKYLEAAAIFTMTGNEARIFYTYSNLSIIYTFLDNRPKMTFYANAAYEVSKKTGQTTLMLRGLLALVGAYTKLEKYDSLFIYARKGLSLASDKNEPFFQAKFHQVTGIYYMEKTRQYDSAVSHFSLALEGLTKVNSQYDIPIALHYLGDANLMKKNYPEAIAYFKKAIALDKTLGLHQLLLYTLEALVRAEATAGNIKDAFQDQKILIALKDSVQKNNNNQQVNELEAKYQTQKKETLLLAQEVRMQKQNNLNYALAGTSVAIFFIAILSYRTYRQKQKLQQQRINELETEKKLSVTEAVLKGEERERTRLAQELHDGLGGMLSGIKYSMTTIKGNIIMTPDNHQSFERSMDMLDSSIQEMRRVAHNMMPEALVKFGLDTALKDFSNAINQSGALQIAYQSIGLSDAVIGQTTAIIIYRIIQELINNIMKHAAAKTAVVQVSKSNGIIAVTVEDDGKGFDTAVLEKPAGIGWINIRSRVDFLKGTLDVQSDPGKGTSVHIELING